METEEVRLRLARNAQKYEHQLEQRSKLTVVMTAFQAGNQRAIRRMDKLLHVGSLLLADLACC